MHNPNFVSYEDASKWAKQQNFLTSDQWFRSKRPPNIPYNPPEIYPEWLNWKVFLNNNDQGRQHEYVSYQQAKKWTQYNKIKNQLQYESAQRPINLPLEPWQYYKDTGEWISPEDFFGPNYASNFVNKPTMATYEEASQWAISQDIENNMQYMRTAKPANIPISPETYYKSQWIDWPTFLGTNKGQAFEKRNTYLR